jgi:hypothetical protein
VRNEGENNRRKEGTEGRKEGRKEGTKQRRRTARRTAIQRRKRPPRCRRRWSRQTLQGHASPWQETEQQGQATQRQRSTEITTDSTQTPQTHLRDGRDEIAEPAAQRGRRRREALRKRTQKARARTTAATATEDQTTCVTARHEERADSESARHRGSTLGDKATRQTLQR